MRELCYVVVRSNGDSYFLKSELAPESKTKVLPELLHEGWRPVREVAMGGGSGDFAYSLVLMERPDPNLTPPPSLAMRRRTTPTGP